jgi:hypothetical protein
VLCRPSHLGSGGPEGSRSPAEKYSAAAKPQSDQHDVSSHSSPHLIS